MKKKRSTRLTVSFTDILVAILCFAGMFYCLFLFWQDINVSFTKSNEEPIGVIYFKKNTAQRKLIDSNIWERLKTSTPIYNGDKIRTAGMSEAYTVFDDCSKIDIHENTLIQIFSKKDKNSVEFISGSISVLATPETKTSGLKIQTGDKVLNFTENTSAVISSSPKTTNQVIITVTSGSVQMHNNTDKSHQFTKIDAGNCIVYEPISLKPEVKLELEKSIVKPLQAFADFSVTMPTSSYSITRSENSNQYVPFFWSGTKEIQIDFSTDAAFQNVIATRNLVSNSGRATVDINFIENEDTIFWKAYPLPLIMDASQTQAEEFPMGVIFIHSPLEMKMYTPIISVFGDEKAAAVMEKEVSKNEEQASSKILAIIGAESSEIEEELETEELVQQNEEPVVEQAVTKTEPAPEPEPVVDKTPSLVSVTPSLSAPAKGTVYTEDDLLINGSIDFKWKSVDGAKNYTFVITDSSGKSLLSKAVNENSYTLTELDILDSATFGWSVTANTTVDGQSYSSKTAVSNFVVKISELEDSEIDESNLLQ